MMGDLIELPPLDETPESRCVVKLVTTEWADHRGLHVKRSLLYQKRKSCGVNFLDEDVSAAGSKDVIATIVDLESKPDGLYEVRMTNISRDWETGYIDGFDYELIPFVE